MSTDDYGYTGFNPPDDRCDKCGELHATSECPYGRDHRRETLDRQAQDILDNARLAAQPRRGPVHAVDYPRRRIDAAAYQRELARLRAQKRSLERWLMWALVGLVAALVVGLAIIYRIQGLTGGVQ